MNIFKFIQELWGKQSFIIKVITFPLLVLPFVMLGILLKYLLTNVWYIDITVFPGLLIYTMIPIVLFAIFLFSTFKDHK